MSEQKILIIAGPNGAGKTTFAREFLPNEAGCPRFVNADLIAAGIEAALDDRGARPGSMFADADLIGIPHRVVIGDKGLATQQFEYKHRKAATAEMVQATLQAVLAKLG